MVMHASSISADSSQGTQNFVACYDIHEKPKTTHITAIHIKITTSKVKIFPISLLNPSRKLNHNLPVLKDLVVFFFKTKLEVIKMT